MEFYFLRELCNAFFVYTLWFYLYKYSSWLALTQQFFETSTVGSQLCIILYSPLLVFSKKVIARNRIITQFFWETKIIFFFFSRFALIESTCQVTVSSSALSCRGRSEVICTMMALHDLPLSLSSEGLELGIS